MSKFKVSSAVGLLAAVAMGCDVDINAVTGGPEEGVTPEYASRASQAAGGTIAGTCADIPGERPRECRSASGDSMGYA